MARFVFNPFSGTFDAVNDPSDEPLVFSAECGAEDAVNQFVFLAGTGAGNLPLVSRADPTDSAKMPAIGVIVNKASDTACTVAWFGAVRLGGLVPGGVYYLDTTGFVTTIVPSARPVYVQTLGQGLSTEQLLLSPSKDLFNVAV